MENVKNFGAKATSTPVQSSNMPDAINSLKKNVENKYDNLQKQIRDTTDTGISFVRRHPLSSLAGAIALGFITGALIGRRH